MAADPYAPFAPAAVELAAERMVMGQLVPGVSVGDLSVGDIAQVCKCVWQLRGWADGCQVEGARVAVTANQGLFGHGSSVLVTR